MGKAQTSIHCVVWIPISSWQHPFTGYLLFIQATLASLSFKALGGKANSLSFVTTKLSLCSAVLLMTLTGDISLINHENQGEVVSHWFVVFSRHCTQRSQSKALCSLLHRVARLVPSTWSAPSGPVTTWKWEAKLVNHKPGSSGLGQISVVQTHKQCPSGAGYAVKEALLWGRCGGGHQPSLPIK